MLLDPQIPSGAYCVHLKSGSYVLLDEDQHEIRLLTILPTITEQAQLMAIITLPHLMYHQISRPFRTLEARPLKTNVTLSMVKSSS